MSAEATCLVIGGNGYIGSWLKRQTGSEVYFSQHRLEEQKLIDEIKEKRCSVLILGGISNFQQIKKDPEKAWKINVDTTIRVINECEKLKRHIIYTSSESVFDGETGYYQEVDEPNPIFDYGKMKAQCENYIKSNTNKYSIVRLSKVYSSEPDNTLLSSVINTARNKVNATQPIYTYDSKFSPVNIQYVVKGLGELINSERKGVFHFAGVEAYSRADIDRFTTK